jgi:hypothetical protein
VVVTGVIVTNVNYQHTEVLLDREETFMVVEPTKTFTSMTIPVIMQVECVQVSQVWPGTKIPTGPDFFQVGKVYNVWKAPDCYPFIKDDRGMLWYLGNDLTLHLGNVIIAVFRLNKKEADQ